MILPRPLPALPPEPTPERGGVTFRPATGHLITHGRDALLTHTATFLLVPCAQTPGHDIETADLPPRRPEASPVPSP